MNQWELPSENDKNQLKGDFGACLAWKKERKKEKKEGRKEDKAVITSELCFGFYFKI
jgi:hypothetical protein